MGNEQQAGSSRFGMAQALALVGLGLLANAGASLYTRGSGASGSGGGLDLSLDQKAFAQALQSPNPQQMLGARGLYMMPAQLGPQVWGVYLMDVDSGTFCVYQAVTDGSGGRVNRLRLAAARSFKQDRFLEDWNNENPTPAQVGALVQQQRTRMGLRGQTAEPTVDTGKAPPEAPDAGVNNGPDLPGRWDGGIK